MNDELKEQEHSPPQYLMYKDDWGDYRITGIDKEFDSFDDCEKWLDSNIDRLEEIEKVTGTKIKPFDHEFIVGPDWFLYLIAYLKNILKED